MNLLNYKIFPLKKYLILLLIITNYLNAQELKFRHLSVDDGLSQNNVTCMLEDRSGFLWFGTYNGLNRFDGYQFKIFRHDSKDRFSISNNNIWSLFEDNKGNIWIGTQSGILNRFNPYTEKFEHFNLDSSNLPDGRQAVLSGNSITSIFQDKAGKLWVGTYKGGLYQLDINTGSVSHWKNQPDNPNSLSNNFVTSTYEDLKGNLWIGTYNGLCLFKNDASQNSFIRFYHEPTNQNSLSHNLIWTIYQSKNDPEKIWVGTFNGLTRIEIEKNLFTRFIPDQNNPNQFSRSISSICEETSGNGEVFWIGTYGGLIKLNLPAGMNSIQQAGTNNIQFNRWTHQQNDPSSLSTNLINKLWIDRSGVLWIAGQTGINYYSALRDKFGYRFESELENPDLNKLSGLDVQTITQTTDLPDGLPTEVGKAGKTIWAGTTTGLYAFNQSGKTFRAFKNNHLSDQNIWSLAPGSSDDLWIGTYGHGLMHLDLKSGNTQLWTGNSKDSQDISNAYVKAIHQDKSGFLWIGLWGVGLNRMDPKTGEITKWRFNSNNTQSLSYDDVWVIFEDKIGRIWIGTFGGGLNLFSSSNEGSFYKWLSDPDAAQSLSNNNILSICESLSNKDDSSLEPEPDGKTVLWIGTANGLNKFSISNSISTSKGDKIEAEIEHYLLNKEINSITEDNNGHLWITTNNGLIEFDPLKGILNTYTISDGLQSNEFNPNSVFKTENGEIFIGSINGLNVFHPDSIIHSNYSPPVVVTDFQVFNHPAPVGPESLLKSSISTVKEIILPYDQNVFSFQFAALDYNIPEMNQYAYKMEGFDKDWIYSGTRRFVTYTNLDPGEYVFHVKGTNSDGVWNEKGIQLSVIINPPFWQTWWFRGIVFLFFIGAAAFIYKWRISNLEKEKKSQEEFSKRLIQSQEEERKRIASELHDSLGQNLLIIKNRAVLGLKSEETEFEKKQLNEISANASSAIDEVRRIAYNLHPYQLERLGLKRAIRSIVDNLESSTGINFKIEIDDIDNVLKSEEEINLYRIIQECINNIVKHSESKNAFVSIRKEDKIIIKIDDNGKGFRSENLNLNLDGRKGFGLKNLQERVKLLKGELIIDSSENKGTKIQINIPLHNDR